MLASGHQFSQDIVALLRKNQQQFFMCLVQRSNQNYKKTKIIDSKLSTEFFR